MNRSKTLIQEQHIQVTSADSNAAEILANASGLSKQQIKQAMLKGAVWITRGKQTTRLRRAKKTLKVNDVLHLYFNQQVLSQSIEPPQLLHDAGEFSIWYKPYGVLCQGSKWGDHTTINRYAEQYLTPQRPAFIVHRLDRATRGLMVIAHSKSTAANLSAQFEARNTKKYYQAIVQGQFPAEKSVTSPIDEKSASSHMTCLEYDQTANRSLIEVHIETGRKHQIRIHCNELGFPIIGDRLHGCQIQKQQEHQKHQEDLQLCACGLSFVHPISGEILQFELPQQYRLILKHT